MRSHSSHRDDFLLERREECTQISMTNGVESRSVFLPRLIDFRMGWVEQIRDIEQTGTVRPASEKHKSGRAMCARSQYHNLRIRAESALVNLQAFPQNEPAFLRFA